jgi:hypothetical protein
MARAPMTTQEKDWLIAFLGNKMCRPCLKDGVTVDHEGCIEAESLIEIVKKV